MSDNINIKITADASDAKSKTQEVKRELTGLEEVGTTASAGLKTAMLGVTLAMAPIIAALATIKTMKALVSLADEATEADNKVALLAGRIEDVQPTISGAFAEIKNAVVLFARAINDGTGMVGVLGRTLSEVAQVIALFARSMTDAGDESDKLAHRQGAIQFAQNVGKAFAWMVDVATANLRSLADNVMGILGLFSAVATQMGDIVKMRAAAARGDAATVSAAWAEFQRVGTEATMRLGTAIGESAARQKLAWTGAGEALRSYLYELQTGARIDLSAPEKATQEKITKDKAATGQGDELQPIDVYRKKGTDPLAGADTLEPIDVYRKKLKDPLAGEDKNWPSFLPAASVMQNALDTLFNMQQTWAQKIQGIMQSVASFFTQQLITKPLTEMLMRQVRESAIYKMMFAQQVTQQTAASTATAGIKAGEATAVVGANAAEAASGAAASQASIPYVGWALAAAAFASVMAMVLGAKSQIKHSAAGGFSIPSNLNPVTQLHAEEMVLPADIANPLRESLAGGGGREININVQGASPGDWLLMHKSELARAIKAAHREFAF